MKYVFTILMGFMGHMAWSATHQLPEAEISGKTLGGTVLVIQMKHTLVIDGGAQKAITQELGEPKRKAFYKDIAMNIEAGQLKSKYGSKMRKATNEVIAKYESLVLPKVKLN